MKMHLYALLAFLAASASVAPAAAQVTLLTATNRPLPGTNPPFGPGTNGLSTSAVVTNGSGFAIRGTGAVDFVWGNPGGPTLAGAGFYALGSDFSPTQAFGSGIGLTADGRAVYANNNTLFFGNAVIASVGEVIPSPLAQALDVGTPTPTYGTNAFFGLGAFGDDPFYRVAYRTGGTSNAGTALVRGLPTGSPEVLIRTGQTLAGLPTTIGPANADIQVFSTSFSPAGDNWMTRVQIATDTSQGIESNARQVLVRNGQAVRVGGEIVRQRTQVASPDARAGEIYLSLFTNAVGAGDDYGFTADGFVLGQANSNSRFLVINDDIVLRQGQTVTFGGETLTLSNNFGQLAMNAEGDWALPWFATNATGGRADVLLVNGEVVAATDRTVYDLDGVPTRLGELGFAENRVALGDRTADGTVDVFFSTFLSTTSAQIGYFTTSVVIPEPAGVTLLAAGAFALIRRRRA